MVLADTGAWLAAFHARDQYHEAAAAELRRLRKAGVRLVVTDLIVAELHLHLLYALGPERAADHVEILLQDSSIEEVFTDARLQRSALGDWMQRFRDQAFTLTDAVSFAVMRGRGIGTAFTFDQHFAIAGFRTVPGAVGREPAK
jgi:uncharacterized protein